MSRRNGIPESRRVMKDGDAAIIKRSNDSKGGIFIASERFIEILTLSPCHARSRAFRINRLMRESCSSWETTMFAMISPRERERERETHSIIEQTSSRRAIFFPLYHGRMRRKTRSVNSRATPCCAVIITIAVAITSTPTTVVIVIVVVVVERTDSSEYADVYSVFIENNYEPSHERVGAHRRHSTPRLCARTKT